MRLFLCTTALLALGGCSSMDLNHALGTPKNPTPTFRSLDAKDPATGEDEHLRKLYAELATAAFSAASAATAGAAIATAYTAAAKARLAPGMCMEWSFLVTRRGAA